MIITFLVPVISPFWKKAFRTDRHRRFMASPGQAMRQDWKKLHIN
jgi:hypothetical protein